MRQRRVRALSIAALLSVLVGLFIAVGAAPASARSDNCGEGLIQEVINGGPDGIFETACAHHDNCYWGTSGKNRLQCDAAFLAEMDVACHAHYHTNGWPPDALNPSLLACYTQAQGYYSAVRNFGWIFWAGPWWMNV